jgi:hypothetical protein
VQQCQTRQIPLDEIFVSLIKAEQQASTTAVRA